MIAGIVLLAAASWWMAELGAPLATETSPAGIVDFELAGSAERASEILAGWNESARSAARRQTRWDDWLYVPVYVLVLASWASWCARRLRTGWLATSGVLLSWAMLAAGLLDWIENRQLMWQLAHGADAARAGLAAACATAKFAIVFATNGYALAATARIALQRWRPPAATDPG